MLAKAQSLLKEGEGLLALLYHAKVLLLEECQEGGSIQEMRETKLIKILIRIEKRFPQPADLSLV